MIENINSDGSCAFFLVLFRLFGKFFCSFSTFSKQNRRKKCTFLRIFTMCCACGRAKNSQERTFFLRFCFEKRRKRIKNIFQKRRKRIRKISTRTIKIYVLDQQIKKKREQEMLFLSFSMFSSKFLIF